MSTLDSDIDFKTRSRVKVKRASADTKECRYEETRIRWNADTKKHMWKDAIRRIVRITKCDTRICAYEALCFEGFVYDVERIRIISIAIVADTRTRDTTFCDSKKRDTKIYVQRLACEEVRYEEMSGNQEMLRELYSTEVITHQWPGDSYKEQEAGIKTLTRFNSMRSHIDRNFSKFFTNSGAIWSDVFLETNEITHTGAHCHLTFLSADYFNVFFCKLIRLSVTACGTKNASFSPCCCDKNPAE